MSIQQGNAETNNVSGHCLYDLLRMETSAKWGQRQKEWNNSSSSPQGRLKSLLSESGNRLCTDCGSRDPKWVSLSFGAFICIKCSGVHRSLGAHITKVLSVKLDEWTQEQVDDLIKMGGNIAVNLKYEACIPENYQKPKSNSSIEEREDFIRRKYELQQFLNDDLQMSCPFPFSSSSNCSALVCHSQSPHQKKHYEKQITSNRMQGIGHAFRNSWRRSESKATKKSTSMLVYDKDTFTPDDFMGDAEIDIQPLVTAAKAFECSSLNESTQLGKWKASKENALVSDGVINFEDGRVKQDIAIQLQNVERGVLEIELECMPLTQ